MRSRILLALAITVVFAISHALSVAFRPASPPAVSHGGPYRRIVSMAPSVTETFYRLGLGDRLVGVTRFCNYPPEAREKPRIGDLLTPNLEATLALKPDLVVVLSEHEQRIPSLRELGLPLLVVNHQTMEGVLDSIAVIGQACGAAREAAKLQASLRERIRAVRRRSAAGARPTVLLSVDRAWGSGRIEDVYAAADDGYFTVLVQWAGGRNVLREQAARFPTLSAEGIIALNPQVIIDMAGAMPDAAGSRQEKERRDALLRDWQSLPRVAAVRDRRVYFISDARLGLPGPSSVDLLERLSQAIHDRPPGAAQ